MHIHQLTIQGFKSYKDETTIGPFHPAHNAVVGANGSGKSNFFAAIRFVLGDAYGRLGQEERLALIHDNEDPNNTNTEIVTSAFSDRPLSAFVEIVFANDDHRLPTAHNTCTIRRTISAQQDTWSLDGKSVTKQDVMSLLQAAGFSRSNPYFIVPQGRIAALTVARDTERLALLKEVAGTRVYEEHRAESLRIMDETDLKRQKIGDLLAFIKDRLTELETEKEDLSKWKQLDRQRKTCELLLYQRELNDLADSLRLLEEAHSKGALLGSEDAAGGVALLNSLQAQLRTVSGELQVSNAELEVLQEELEETVKSKAEFEMAITEAETTLEAIKQQAHSFSQSGSSKQGKKPGINTIAKIVAEKEALVLEFKTQHGNLVKKEAALRVHVQELEIQHSTLANITQQQQSHVFKNTTEREAWLSQEITLLTRNRDLAQSGVKSIEQDLYSLAKQREQLLGQQELESHNKNSAKSKNDGDQIKQVATKRQAALDRRKELWRQQHRIEAIIEAMEGDLEIAERDLAYCMDRGTWQGLRALPGLCSELFGSDAQTHVPVIGPLYTLYSCTPEHRLALDQIAGGSLFHVVVRDDQVAQALMEKLTRDRLGRLTFIPLNRIRANTAPINDDDDDDEDNPGQGNNFFLPDGCTPLVKLIQCDSLLTPVMNHVFGRGVLVPNLDIGSKVARQYRLTAVTLDGDRVDRRGALTGGSNDITGAETRRSPRYQACLVHINTLGRLKEHREELASIMDRLLLTEQQVAQTTAELNKLQQQPRSQVLTNSSSKHLIQLRDLTAIEQLIQAKQKTLDQALVTLRTTEQQLTVMYQQQGATSKRKDNAKHQLDALTTALDQARREHTTCSKQLEELSTTLAQAESELEQKLRPQLQAFDRGGDERNITIALLDLHRKSLAQSHASIEETKERIDQLIGHIDSLGQSMTTLQGSIEQAQQTLDQSLREADKQAASAARYASRKQALLNRREDCVRRVRELAIQPDSAIEQRFREAPSEQVLREMHTLAEQIRACGPVNRKAQDQHSTFTKQSEALIQRQRELDVSAQAIQEFIRALDQKKDECIRRTFDQVSTNFERIFVRLVPTGHARLVMQQDSQSMDYTGVSIKVSFNSQHEDEGLLMNQLSGGQKSLVALTLIFAIQQSDPAPFYLFDEVDANLDTAHRASVAAMINDLSHQPPPRPFEEEKENGEQSDTMAITNQHSSIQSSCTQFITTTFRTELLEHADKYWGVSLQGHHSIIQPISCDQAVQFVNEDLRRILVDH